MRMIFICYMCKDNFQNNGEKNLNYKDESWGRCNMIIKSSIADAMKRRVE